MSIMDIFKASPAAPVPPAASPASAAPATPPVSDANKEQAAAQTPVNPLDAYAKMYEDANKSSDIRAPVFKIDPKVLGDVSKGMDFTKGIDQSMMERALAGDARSLLAVIQSVGQNSYSASLEHATVLTDTHLGQRADFESKRISAGVKTQLTNSALSDAPNYSHPVVKAELNRVASMIAASNPDASPAQIAQAAQKQLQDLAAALVPQKSQEQQQADSGETDWSKYLTS